MINLKVMPDDGEAFDLTATTRDIAKWERITKGASFAGLQNDMKITNVYQVSHIAAVRLGLFSGTLAEWQESVDLDILDSDEPDPTQSAA